VSFAFKPAVREQVSLLIALAGASGSGKTYSALRLARGLSQTGKVAFIDTEARRGLHYAGQFEFLHADMRPPFRPERFIEAIRAAEDAGADVVIIDSMSHEYDGEGGIMDWADQLEAGGTKSPGNWKVPKGAHKKMMNALLQCRASLIFCLRADEKIRIAKENGKTVIEPLGWMPICEKRFMYEMTASFTLTPDRPGFPRFDLPHKLQKQHRGIFSEREPIGEDAGKRLLDWSRGGNPAPAGQPQTPSEDRVQQIIDEARAAATNGLTAYQAHFGALAAPDKRALVDSGEHDKLKAFATKADQAPEYGAETEGVQS
jgi:hypothetical protein